MHMKYLMNSVQDATMTLIKRGIALGITMSLLGVSLAVAEPTTGIEGSAALKTDIALAATDDFGGDFPRHKVSVSMYNADPRQTDDTPFITANGDDLRNPKLGRTAAMNGVPFGTKFFVPKLGITVTINDRMNKRYDSTYMDIYELTHADALRFGRQNLEIVQLN